MTIEATLERIAVALEAIAKNGAMTSAATPTAAVAAVGEAVRKTRAAKAVEQAQPAAPVAEAPAETEADPFAAAEETKVYTREDVRNALLKCQERLGPAAAQAVFKKASGVDTLPNLKDESKFATVIAAANAAK